MTSWVRNPTLRKGAWCVQLHVLNTINKVKGNSTLFELVNYSWLFRNAIFLCNSGQKKNVFNVNILETSNATYLRACAFSNSMQNSIPIPNISFLEHAWQTVQRRAIMTIYGHILKPSKNTNLSMFDNFIMYVLTWLCNALWYLSLCA